LSNNEATRTVQSGSRPIWGEACSRGGANRGSKTAGSIELQAADTRASAATHTTEQIADGVAALQYLDFGKNTRYEYLLITTQVYVATRAVLAHPKAI
jgi:hypothetical protein